MKNPPLMRDFLAALLVFPALGCGRRDAAFWKQKYLNEINYHYQTQQLKNAEIAARDLEAATKDQYVAILTSRINELTQRIEELEKKAATAVPPPEAGGPAEGKITAVAGEINMVVLSLGKENGVSVGREVWIYRGEEYVGRAAVDRAEAKWSSALIRERKTDPRVGDAVRSRPR